jgi:hypothetical protein
MQPQRDLVARRTPVTAKPRPGARQKRDRTMPRFGAVDMSWES